MWEYWYSIRDQRTGQYCSTPFLYALARPACAEGAAAIVSVLGLIVTIFLLPETKGKSLEELSEEPSTPMEKAAA